MNTVTVSADKLAAMQARIKDIEAESRYFAEQSDRNVLEMGTEIEAKDAEITMLREALEDIQFHIVTTQSVESLESSIQNLKGLAQSALTATSSDGLHTHDAEVIRNAAKRFEDWFYSPPTGFVLVPVEPSDKLLAAIRNENVVYQTDSELYAALITAAQINQGETK